jgi:hypothetical protein
VAGPVGKDAGLERTGLRPAETRELRGKRETWRFGLKEEMGLS